MPRDDFYLVEIVEAPDFVTEWLEAVAINAWATNELLQSAGL